MAFTTVTVTRDYDLADGTDPAGTVTFTPTTPMVNGVTVVAAPVTARLDVDGLLSIQLAANTDPATAPVGTAYLVEESIAGTTRSYYVTVPHDEGSTINLADLATIGVAPTLSFPAQVYKRAEDPRAYGLTGGANDSPALQACINAAGAGGVVELPPLTINYGTTLTLPSGLEFRGSGMKASTLAGATDIACLSMLGGEGQAIKNLKISNSFTGTRTTYDIDIANPFKPLLEHIEIALSQSSLVKGGIRLYKATGQTGDDKCFMPVLTDIWVRNGTLRIADVTDAKITGGWVWGTYTGAPGAVELSAASNCSFTDFDLVPSADAGYLISGGLNNLSIIGGLIDGSYDGVTTGWGIKCTDYVRGLSVTGVKFYNLSLGGVNITDIRRSTFVGNIFIQNNKGDNSYPDITVASAVGNVFAQNSHGAPNSRTNKGRIYVEDSNSSDNIVTQNVLEINSSISPNGHYYDTAMFTVQTSTAITGNRPQGNWPTSTALAKTSTYAITKDDLFNHRTVFATSGTFTITLPSVNSVHAGDDVIIKNTGAGTITIATTSSQTIDGSTTKTLTANQGLRIMSSGSGAWAIVAQV
jgi:hypothetical protein